MNNPKKFEGYLELFAVLTLEELEAGFVVSCAPLLLSLLVYCFEWIKCLIDLIICRLFFKKHFDLKHSEQKRHSALMKVKVAKWQAAIKKMQKEREKKVNSLNK